MKFYIKLLLTLLAGLIGCHLFSQEEPFERKEKPEQLGLTINNQASAQAIEDYYKRKYSNSSFSNAKTSSSSSQTDHSNWEFFGPDEVPKGNQRSTGTGRLSSFYLDETTGDWYVGSGRGGTWIKKPIGNWQPLTNDYRLRGSVGALQLDDQGNIWCLSAIGNKLVSGNKEQHIIYGILKSEDGGATWVQKNNGIFSPGEEYKIDGAYGPKDLVIDPNNSSVMYFCTSKHLFKSTNAGENWVELSSSSSFPTLELYDNMSDIQVDPLNSNRLWVSGNRILFSNDGGSTWQFVTDNILGTNLRSLGHIMSNMDERFPDKIWFTYFKEIPYVNNGGDVYIDGNGDTLFRKKQFITEYDITNDVADVTLEVDAGYFQYLSGLEFSKTMDKIYIYGTEMAMYDITTQTAENINNYYTDYDAGPGKWLHVDIRGISVYEEGGKDRLYICSDGGLHTALFDNTTNFDNAEYTHISQNDGGIFTYDVSRLDVSSTNPDFVTAGFWDMNFVYKNESGWHSTAGNSDGTACFIDYLDEDFVIGLNAYGSVRKFYLDTEEYQSIYYYEPGATSKTNVRSSIIRRPPGTLDPVNPNLFYAARRDGGLYKVIINKGQDIRTDPSVVDLIQSTSKHLSAVAVAPSNTNVIYTAYFKDGSNTSVNDLFYRSIDGGTSWTAVSQNGLDGYKTGYVSDIAINPRNHLELWVSFELTYGSDRIYHSTDGGDSWSDLSTGYPSNLAATSIEYDEITGFLYAGTFCGVLVYDPSIGSWESFDRCMPPTQVYDIKIQESHRYLYASTFGRGIWRTPLKHCNEVSTLDVSGNITDDQGFQAASSISSTAKITNDNSVGHLVDQGGVIRLKPGFEAKNSFFRATTVEGSCTSCSQGSLFRMSNAGETYVPYSFLQEDDSEKISIAPNPSNGVFQIHVLDMESASKYEILDLEGRVITLGSISTEIDFWEVNMSHASRGLYILKVYDNNGDSVSKKLNKL